MRPNTPRPQRSDEELQKASDHLFYEYGMLNELANAMASGQANKDWCTNALLESFIIHFRCVMDFLYNDDPRPDDVVAQDFFSSADTWEKSRPQLTDLLKTAKKRTGKELAHLTYKRQAVTPDRKPWPFLAIVNDINSVMDVFLKKVSQTKLGSQWKFKYENR